MAIVEQVVATHPQPALRTRGRVTLVYAARDQQRNHAVALRQVLEERYREQ